MNFKHLITACASALLLAATGAAPAAAAYPERPIKLVVPFPPGGTSDSLARVLAKGMSEKLGQPIIVDNRGGGGTVIGTEAVLRAPADGYTLMWATTPLAINDSLLPKLPYDTLKDVVPVVTVAQVPLVLIVPADSPLRTLADLIAKAKAQPGTLTYGSSGNGGSPHLATAMLSSMAEIDLVHIPYKGSAPSVLGLIAGQTDLAFDTLFLTLPQVQSGKARALAQSSDTRSPLLPDVPTVAEAGLKGYKATSWFMLAVRTGTPAEIVERLNKVANEVLADPDLRKDLARQGLQVAGGSIEEAGQHLRGEIEKWGKIVRASGAQAQ